MSFRKFGSRRPVTVDFSSDDRTHQSFKDQCDVNNILKKFVTTGHLSHQAKGVPQYMDTTSVGDYFQAMEVVMAVNDFFEDLPAAVKKEFQNRPEDFLEFVQTAPREELAKRGLLKEEAIPKGETEGGGSAETP